MHALPLAYYSMRKAWIIRFHEVNISQALDHNALLASHSVEVQGRYTRMDC